MTRNKYHNRVEIECTQEEFEKLIETDSLTSIINKCKKEGISLVIRIIP